MRLNLVVFNHGDDRRRTFRVPVFSGSELLQQPTAKHWRSGNVCLRTSFFLTPLYSLMWLMGEALSTAAHFKPSLCLHNDQPESQRKETQRWTTGANSRPSCQCLGRTPDPSRRPNLRRQARLGTVTCDIFYWSRLCRTSGADEWKMFFAFTLKDRCQSENKRERREREKKRFLHFLWRWKRFILISGQQTENGSLSRLIRVAISVFNLSNFSVRKWFCDHFMILISSSILFDFL